jgi:hypothetical protein
MCPLLDAPALTLGGAYTVLPVAHKYGFSKIVTTLVDFVKGQPLLTDPQHPSTYIMRWVVLAEQLQLDDLLEQRMKELEVMPADGLAQALLLGASGGQPTAAMHEQMEELHPVTRNRLLAMTTSRLRDASRRELAAKSAAAAAATAAEEKLKRKLNQIHDTVKYKGWEDHFPSDYFSPG